MAKRKRVEVPPEDIPSGLAKMAALASGVDAELRREYGDNVQSYDEYKHNVSGIDLNKYLALAYMFGADVLPLKHSLSIVGPPGTMKTTIAWFLAKLCIEAPGVVQFLNAEQKDNPWMVAALIRDENVRKYAISRIFVDTLDMLLSVMTKGAAAHRAGDPNGEFVLCQLIDSLGSVTSAEIQKELEDSGDVSDGYGAARAAAKLTQGFRAFRPAYLNRLPMLQLIINHTKEKMQQKAGGGGFRPPAKGEPGGAHKDFMYSFIIETALKNVPNTVSEERKVLILKHRKTMTTDKRSVEVPLSVTKVQSADEDFEHVLEFKWGEALVHLLTGGAKLAKSDVAERLDLSVTGKEGSCKGLSPEKLSLEELGQFLQTDPEMRRETKFLLGIHTARKWPF